MEYPLSGMGRLWVGYISCSYMAAENCLEWVRRMILLGQGFRPHQVHTRNLVDPGQYDPVK